MYTSLVEGLFSNKVTEGMKASVSQRSKYIGIQEYLHGRLKRHSAQKFLVHFGQVYIATRTMAAARSHYKLTSARPKIRPKAASSAAAEAAWPKKLMELRT